MDDEKVKVEVIYGFASAHADVPMLVLSVEEPKPIDVIAGAARDLLWGVVVPAFLFAVAWTLLTLPFHR